MKIKKRKTVKLLINRHFFYISRQTRKLKHKNIEKGNKKSLEGKYIQRKSQESCLKNVG